MTWFQTTYTVRYNVRHHTSGHLYGGRYKAILVEAPEDGSAGDGDYFTTLVDYIHLKERMLAFAEDLLSRRSGKRDSSKNYRGAETNDYDLKRAEAILAAGLEVFGISESELSDLKKSADEKGLIAMIIRLETTVRSAWLATKLQMGTVANVTRVSNAMATHLQDDKKL